MPSKRAKRQKIAHQSHTSNHTQSPNAPLSHDQIWDDSYLVNSWNAALKEYKYYYSLAAQGLDPDDVVNEAEVAEADGRDVDLKLDGEGMGPGMDDGVRGYDRDEGEADEGEVDKGEVDKGEVDDGEVEDGEVADVVPASGDKTNGILKAPQIGPERLPTSTPDQPVLPNGNAAEALAADQILENVKMAYYWAGYYSGVYDTQRQAANGGGESQ